MSILVVGSVAFDALQTPFGKVDRCIGGSATYFSVAASFFTEVSLVAVVGDDFTEEDASIFGGATSIRMGCSESPARRRSSGAGSTATT